MEEQNLTQEEREEIEKQKVEAQTKTLRSKLSNFWFYNKWKLLFGAFILLFVGICIVQMAEKTDYDTTILYVGPTVLSTDEKAAIESAIGQILLTDTNGDGLKNAALNDMTIFTDAQLQEIKGKISDASELMKYSNYSEDKRKTSFTQEMFAGQSVICLLDPYWYEIVKAQDGFLPLAEVLGEKPENAADDYSVRLADTGLAAFFDCFAALPEDTVLCVRRLSTAASFTNKKNAETNHETQLAIFRRMLEFSME